MIKKIILLVLSFAFSVTSVVYGSATNATPVSSGTGTGTSAKIANTQALSKLMSQIPSYDDYTANENISDSEAFSDFQSFTMVETGYGLSSNETTTYRSVVEDGEITTKSYVKETDTMTNHQLSISFTETAVYYHSVGSTVTTNTYYTYEYENGYYNYYFDTDFVDAERTIVNFDAEIYHSKEETLIKYNQYETIEEVSDRLDQYNEPVFTAKPEENLDAEEQMEKEMQEKVNKIVQSNYGVWLKLDKYDEEDLEDMFEDLENANPDPETMTEAQKQQYINAMIDYMVYQTCALTSEMQAKSFATANASNCEYLTRLASFITSDTIEFEKEGNEYDLVTEEQVAIGEDEYGNTMYETVYTGKNAYVSTIFGSGFTNTDYYSTNVNFSYALCSDVGVIDQRASWYQSGSYTGGLNNSFTMETITHFFAVNNTVAAIEKGAKVKTITEAYGDGLREIYSDYLQNAMSGEAN